jgi:hypothetical protein
MHWTARTVSSFLRFVSEFVSSSVVLDDLLLPGIEKRADTSSLFYLLLLEIV